MHVRDPDSTVSDGPRPARRWRRTAAIVALLVVVLAGALAVFFPHDTLDRFLAGRITRAIETTWPGHRARIGALRYEIAANRIAIDSLTITREDLGLSFSVASLLVGDVPRLELLWTGEASPSALARTSVDARDIIFMFPRAQYMLRCARARLAGADSTIRVDSMELRSWPGDEAYFAASAFRRTRFGLLLRAGDVRGIDVPGVLAGNSLVARTVAVDGIGLDVLINKERPFDLGAPPPLMPMDLLAMAGRVVSFDTIRVTGGQVSYGERVRAQSPPGILAIDEMDLQLTGMHTQGGAGDSAFLVAHGMMMRQGRMEVRIALPLDAQGPAFRATGTLGEMPIASLNPFLEIAEQTRLETGSIHAVNFEIAATTRGSAGTIHAAYKDLKVVALDHTGSENGVANTLMSIFANNVKLRTTNLPDASGSMKIGTIHHVRAADEAFLEYAWFSVRSGLKDIVGF